MSAVDTPTWNLNLGTTEVVGSASRATAPVPHGHARPHRAAGRSVNPSLPSVRGTVLAAFGAITSLGCAAAIGLVSIAGSPASNSPGTHQPVSTVQAQQVAGR